MRFWSLTGYIPYASATALQKQLVDLRAKDLIDDTVLFLEHESVITRGRGLQYTGAPRPQHMPLISPLPPGIAFAESERGGDLTFHGPGQLVVYPILKLDGNGFAPFHDVGGYIRRLEQILIEVLREIGIDGKLRKNATGVWVKERKLASIGIAVRKWVTYHGMAINIVNALEPFHLISPCGYSPEVMTRLKDLCPSEPRILSKWWRNELEKALSKQMMSCPVISTQTIEQAQEFLASGGFRSESTQH